MAFGCLCGACTSFLGQDNRLIPLFDCCAFQNKDLIVTFKFFYFLQVLDEIGVDVVTQVGILRFSPFFILGFLVSQYHFFCATV